MFFSSVQDENNKTSVNVVGTGCHWKLWASKWQYQPTGEVDYKIYNLQKSSSFWGLFGKWGEGGSELLPQETRQSGETKIICLLLADLVRFELSDVNSKCASPCNSSEANLYYFRSICWNWRVDTKDYMNVVS